MDWASVESGRECHPEGGAKTSRPRTWLIIAERGCVPSQWRRAVMFQARELNQTLSALRWAESVSRRRPSASGAAEGTAA